MIKLVFLGPPGSGKGTQATRLASTRGIKHLSTGDLLREAVRTGTPLGHKAESYMTKGELVPDDLIVALIESKIDDGSLSSGFILDGFPRTIPQAESLETVLNHHEMPLDRAILFMVPDEELVKRLSGRWFCPTCNEGYNYPIKLPRVAGKCDSDGAPLQRRTDDDEAVVLNRLQVYKRQTEPLVAFYKSRALLTEIDGSQHPDKVFTDLTNITDSVKTR